MNRPLSIFLLAALALSTAALCPAVETFPVVHNDPIIVRILSGKNGLPLINLHLVLIGGYDRDDLHQQFYREDALTDNFGKVRISNQMANLPWLQVWVRSMPLCQSKPRKTSFSVELIRRDGVNAPNLCGPVSAQNTPGLFNVFVKNKAKKLRKGMAISVGGPMNPFMPAPVTVPAATSAMVAPVLAAQPPVTITATAAPVVAAAVSATPSQPSPAPADATARAILPAPITVPPVAIPVTAIAPASPSAVSPTKVVAHNQTRRVAAKRTVHRRKPVPAACSAQPPVAKTTQKSSSAKPVAKKLAAISAGDDSKKAPPKKVTMNITPGSKPLAGVRLEVKKPAQPTAPLKQD